MRDDDQGFSQVDQEFLGFIDELGSINDPGELQDRTSDFLAKRGFDQFTYVGFNPPGDDPKAAVASTFPTEWISHYQEKNYIFIDPAVIMVKRSMTPITWEQITGVDEFSASQKRVVLEGQEFGMRNVINVPIHGPSGDFAFFAASCTQSDAEYKSLLRLRRHELHLIGIHFHTAFCERILSKPEEGEPNLTGRECECLLWAARGKSAWESAEILGIAEDTARKHIKSACRKLGTGSKIHAVVKAIMLGYITP